MGIYFCLEERTDDLPLEKVERKNDRTGEKWTILYQPKVKFETAKTENDYDIKYLYRIMSKFMHDLELESHDIEVEYGYMSTHPGYHRPINISNWIEAAREKITDPDELEVALNTLNEFEKNPRLYYYISY